jgi:hypothetical protein
MVDIILCRIFLFCPPLSKSRDLYMQSIMLPVVLCAIIKKFFCLFKGKALAVFKNEVLVRTFGPKEAA